MPSPGIVFSCIADSSGIIVSQSHNPLLDNVVEVLLESSIDFLIDHKKSFSGHSKTKGYAAKPNHTALTQDEFFTDTPSNTL